MIDARVATRRTEDAQRLCWKVCEERLSVERRAYLKAFPGFEDRLAEQKATEHARALRRVSMALHFQQAWREPRQVAALVLARPTEINGTLDALLDSAAHWLESTSPLAAILLRRAMIADTLDGANTKRSWHAERHLAECQSLAPPAKDHGGFETHTAWVARLRVKHGRKLGVWTQVSEGAHGTR